TGPGMINANRSSQIRCAVRYGAAVWAKERSAARSGIGARDSSTASSPTDGASNTRWLNDRCAIPAVVSVARLVLSRLKHKMPQQMGSSSQCDTLRRSLGLRQRIDRLVLAILTIVLLMGCARSRADDGAIAIDLTPMYGAVEKSPRQQQEDAK